MANFKLYLKPNSFLNNMNLLNQKGIFRFCFLYLLSLLSTYSHSAIVILNGLSHKYTIQSGELYKGIIEISNTSPTPQGVKLYQTDYTFSSNGTIDYGKPGSLKRSNALWIELGETFFVLGALEKRVVNFQILVPKDDTLLGTFWSVIMVEGLAPPDTVKPKGQVMVNTVTRYGIQIITTTGGNGKRELIFNESKLEKREDKRFLVIDAKNTGDFLLEPLMICELFDSASNKIKVMAKNRKKLFPNTSTLFDIDISEIKAGTYNALILADCDDDDAFGIQVSLKLNE